MSKKEVTLNTDDAKTAPAGLKWLFEMEALNSPALLNNLYGNLYAFPNVSDCEILIDRYNRKMLIFVEFTWLVRKVLKSRKKETIISILDNLQELLPSFEFRIVEDRKLFETAVERMQQNLFGGKNESESKNPDSAIDPIGSTDSDSSGGKESAGVPTGLHSKSETSGTDQT